MVDAYEAIRRNLAGHTEWPQSFCGLLSENAEWNATEFWRLHAGLIEAARAAGHSATIDRWLALAVSTIQQRVLSAVVAHYDANDVFTIKGVSSEELYSFVERLEHAVSGVFTGSNLPEADFDLVNPSRV